MKENSYVESSREKEFYTKAMEQNMKENLETE